MIIIILPLFQRLTTVRPHRCVKPFIMKTPHSVTSLTLLIFLNVYYLVHVFNGI